MVNKKTWFAHWFRAADWISLPAIIERHDAARAYSRDLWLNNKWPGQVRKLEWLVEKFNPPGWEMTLEQEKIDEISKTFYQHCHLERREPVWRGVKIVKLPNDLMLYAQVIQENKPDGSSKRERNSADRRCTSRTCSTWLARAGRLSRLTSIRQRLPMTRASPISRTAARIRKLSSESSRWLATDSVMVVLDSDHSRVHVKWELRYYGPMVTPGQYLVVEDCFNKDAKKAGPGEAVDWFLSVHKSFVQTNLDQRYLVGFCRGGWLRRK